MGTTEQDELREISKLLELENIHISEENSRATYVGEFKFIYEENKFNGNYSVNDKDLTKHKWFFLN